MGRKADLAFLATMLTVFLKSPENGASTKEMVARVAADVMMSKMPEMREITPKLFKDFSIGYKNAIKKYGEDEANERMREYLISALCKNIGYTRERLLNYLDGVWNFSEQITEGIHLTPKEENKNDN